MWQKKQAFLLLLFFRVGAAKHGFDWLMALLSLLSVPPQQVHDNLGQPFFLNFRSHLP